MNPPVGLAFKPVVERESSIIAYRVILMAILKDLRQETNQTIIPSYRLDFQRDNRQWFTGLYARAAAGIQRATQRFSGLLDNEQRRHADRVSSSIRRAVRVDVPRAHFTGDPVERRMIQAHIERNASLIRSLTEDTVKRVEQSVYESTLNRESPRRLSVRLQNDFRILRGRADLIAEDQIASINSDLNRVRFERVGIESYVWQTQADNRVRPRHRELQGEVYRWGERTGSENGLQPGKEIRCRCLSVPVILAPSEPAATPAASGPLPQQAANEETTVRRPNRAARNSLIAAFIAGLVASNAIAEQPEQ